jgi:hypothetical protein
MLASRALARAAVDLEHVVLAEGALVEQHLHALVCRLLGLLVLLGLTVEPTTYERLLARILELLVVASLRAAGAIVAAALSQRA